MPASQPRDRLLAAAVGHALAAGLADLSLRHLAEAIGTSHRMLIYHFGSREGLLVAAHVSAGAGEPIARADARPGVAVVRGLLLDLLATKDRAGVTAAYQRFLQRLPAALPAQADG